MIHLCAIVSVLLLFIPLIGLTWRIVKSETENSAVPWTKAMLASMFVAVACLAIVILRPHEHVFQGLDSSAYRLMEKAFAEGRPFTGPDETLLTAPRDLRHWLLLMSETEERNTRDRSFELVSLDNCETKPFFYPFLPLCMLGFDMFVPGHASDFMVPVVALLFAMVCVVVGIARGGPMGALVAMTILAASPLPAWLFRGCYVETISGILIALSVMEWQARPAGAKSGSILSYLALGLALSFHPVMLVLAMPLLGVMLIAEVMSLPRLICAMAAFAVGTLPLILLTMFVASPYGEINLQSMVFGFAWSASIRAAFFTGIVLGIIVLILAVARRRIMSHLGASWKSIVVISALLPLLWIAPAILAMRFWSQGAAVGRGLGELMDGLGWPFAAAIAVLLLHALVSKKTLKARVIATAVFLSLPVFLYLKGAEQMGLWSQRRLIAPLLVTIACCLPSAASLAGAASKAGALRSLRVIAVVAALLFVGLANPVRWPAPYLVQYEKGADAWVEKMLNRIGSRFAVCDCYGYSVPLAVSGKARVIGLSEERAGFKSLASIAAWLAEKAKKEDVLWITAFRNPGLEEEMILEQEGPRESATLYRARAKTSLPAIKEEIVIDAALLLAKPIEDDAAPVLEKTFDAGILGLRPPWGPSGIPIKLPDGKRLPARWSRERSGVIGPVPRPGEAVKISVVAVAGRRDPTATQTLKFSPPWGGEPLALSISNGLTEATGELRRESGQQSDAKRTGVYRIHSGSPYDPATEGIRKFPKDLGALIHRIRIEFVAEDLNR